MVTSVSAPFETAKNLTRANIQSFENVLLLVPRPHENSLWESFLDDVRERNSKPPIFGLSPQKYGNTVTVFNFIISGFNTECNGVVVVCKRN